MDEKDRLLKKTAKGLRRTADWIMFGRSKKGSMARLLLSAPLSVPLILWAATIVSIHSWKRRSKGYPK